MQDIPTDPTSTSVFVLEQLMQKAHPLLQEALNMAAIPHWFSADVLAAMRQHDDSRDEKLAVRLGKFSFVSHQIGYNDEADVHYVVSPLERDLLQRRWLNKDREAYLTAHRRVLAYWEANPVENEFEQVLIRLFHLLIVEGDAGISLLNNQYRQFIPDHRLAAVASLIQTAQEAQKYVRALKQPWQKELEFALDYMQIRLRQYRGEADENATEKLRALRYNPDVSAELRPFLARAYGQSLAQSGDYNAGISQLEFARDQFAHTTNTTHELAYTNLNLGETYVKLGESARGYRQLKPLSPPTTLLDRLSFLRSLTALPLILYLNLFTSAKINIFQWESWLALRGQDWIIARLFASGADYIQQADNIWGKLATQLSHKPDIKKAHADQLQAEEKLGHLYLTMGNPRQAIPIFQDLLTINHQDLSEYRQARIKVELAQALIRTNNPAPALEHLNNALPIIEAYEDKSTQAHAEGLKAEALHATGDTEAAIYQFDKAVRFYHSLRDVVGATEIAERLAELAQQPHLNQESRSAISSTTQRMGRRQYLVPFHHPVVNVFRYLAMVATFSVVFFLPLVTFGGTGVEFVLSYAFWLLLIFFGAYMGLGILILSQTKLDAVQEVGQSENIHFQLSGITIGEGTKERKIEWKDVRRVVFADMFFGNWFVASYSAFVLETDTEQIPIYGRTAWYESLSERAVKFLPNNVERHNVSFQIFPSKMGAWYVATILAFMVYVLLARIYPNSIWQAQIAGISLGKLYPFLYLGLFVPPIYWWVLRPLRSLQLIQPKNVVPFIAGILTLTLALIRLLTFDITWFITPDIYPSLGLLLLAIGISNFIWKAKSPPNTPAYSPNIRYLTLALSTAAVIGTTIRIIVELIQYFQ